MRFSVMRMKTRSGDEVKSPKVDLLTITRPDTPVTSHRLTPAAQTPPAAKRCSPRRRNFIIRYRPSPPRGRKTLDTKTDDDHAIALRGGRVLSQSFVETFQEHMILHIILIYIKHFIARPALRVSVIV